MKREKVESSNIVAVGWEAGRLEVEFAGGAVYFYEDVPEEKFKAFMACSSKGAFMAGEIKGRYKYGRAEK